VVLLVLVWLLGCQLVLWVEPQALEWQVDLVQLAEIQ